MAIYGSIVEYNPFHFGHLYHLNYIRSFEDFEGSVVVMSGNFVQRGEMAIVDKWARTEMALKNGVDLVLELPFAYSIQDARGFAQGAISILENTGIVQKIVFGSETSEIETLKSLASILVKEPERLKRIMKDYLKKGLSFPNARKYALRDYTGISTKAIENSNDILGLEYIYSLLKFNSRIVPITLKRKGANYNDTEIKKEFSSATAIRKSIKDNNDLNVDIPTPTKEILAREFNLGKGPIFYETISDLALSVLNLKAKQDIKRYHGVTEGLENRIKKYLPWVETLEELLHKIKTKRFTYTRLKRTILNILFEITKDDVALFNSLGPQYIKVLGFNDNGKRILAKMRKNANLPIIILSSQYYRTKGVANYKIFKRLFELELSSTQIYKLFFQNQMLRKSYTDFREPIYFK